MANRPIQKAASSQPHFLQFNNLACETAGGKVNSILNIINNVIFYEILNMRMFLVILHLLSTNVVIKGDFCHR